MASFLVFCITDISPGSWAELVDASGAEHWTLVRNQDDIPDSIDTERDIEPFESGFKHHSIQDVEQFFKLLVRQEYKGIIEDVVIIVDERSKTDGTVHITFLSDGSTDKGDVRFRAKFERSDRVAYCSIGKPGLIEQQLEEYGIDYFER